MVNRAQAVAPVMALILTGLAGCATPTEPVVPTPAPTTPAVATPAPAPTPTPTPTATPGEAPVENFMPNWDPNEPIPTRFWARVDVTSKDEKGKETNGNGAVEFFLSNPRYIEVTGGHTNQRRLKALEPTMVDVWAMQDGVQSNKLTLTFY